MYVRLLNLRNSAGQQMYQRLTLCQRLLADRAWVESPEGGGGDEGRALDRLEDECFGDVCGAMSLPQLLEVLEKVPSESAWKANKYNLRKMWAEMKAHNAPAPLKRAKSAAGDPKDAKIERLEGELAAFREKVRELEHENRRLRAAIDKISKIQETLNAKAG